MLESLFVIPVEILPAWLIGMLIQIICLFKTHLPDNVLDEYVETGELNLSEEHKRYMRLGLINGVLMLVMMFFYL